MNVNSTSSSAAALEAQREIMVMKKQQDVKNMLVTLNAELQGALFRPDVRPAGPLALGKGESRKVKHAIDWKLYDKDDLVLRLEASDPSVKVPAER